MRKLPIALLIALPMCASDVRVRIADKTLVLPLETYVAGVIAGESADFKSQEALKAMAVAARTYAVRLRGRHAAEGFDLCSTTHCQLVSQHAVNNRITAAVNDTAGELLWFDGKAAFTTYSANCGGKTEAGHAAYLKSHEDPYCTREPWRWPASGADLAAALSKSGLRVPRVIENVAISKRSASGRALMVALSGGGESVAVSGSSFRFALGRALGWNTLRSEQWNVQAVNGQFIFEGTGGGHGVGLCQFGADRMGADGHSYREILAFYYPGTVVATAARGLKWTRLAGERITLFTTRPDRDRAVLAQAERLSREMDLHSAVELHVYPDVDAFRDATGEPGWVAAYSSGHRIYTQPAPSAVTLRHELLHIGIEDQAAANTPLWFREGLAIVLSRPGFTPRGVPVTPVNEAIRQRESVPRARQAYTAASQQVAELILRYGEPAVLGWLRDGLPPEVMKAMASTPATNSR